MSKAQDMARNGKQRARANAAQLNLHNVLGGLKSAHWPAEMIAWAVRYGTTNISRQHGSVADLMRKIAEEESLHDAVGKEGR
jgi:hypothetical protein